MINDAKTNNPLVSFLIITKDRKELLEKTINSLLKQDYSPFEIVIVDNGSSDGTSNLIKNGFKKADINYIKMEQNLGVAGGRNKAISKAEGRILITIDDDAELPQGEATKKIVSKIQAEDNIGVLTFKVTNKKDKIQKSNIPIRGDANFDKERDVAWFIGVAHAAPKKVYEEVGKYRDFFPYGHEELDLAFRILDKGYKIVYCPEITVMHKTQENRQKRLKERWSLILKNRIKASLLNLPWKYVISTAILWSARTLINTRGNPIPVVKAWHQLLNQRKNLLKKRSVITPNTLRKIKRLGGPLWY